MKMKILATGLTAAAMAVSMNVFAAVPTQFAVPDADQVMAAAPKMDSQGNATTPRFLLYFRVMDGKGCAFGPGDPSSKYAVSSNVHSGCSSGATDKSGCGFQMDSVAIVNAAAGAQNGYGSGIIHTTAYDRQGALNPDSHSYVCFDWADRTLPSANSLVKGIK